MTRSLFLLSIIVLISTLFFALQVNADGYLVRNGQKLFINGANIAWNQFAHDFTDRYHASSLTTLTSWFKNIKDAGGNFARLWIHTNGVDTPAFSNGLVTGMGANRIERITKVLDAAAANGILVELALWSFDLLDPKQWEMTQTNIDQNNALLRTANGRKAYVDKALVPLVKALKGHKGLFGYDIFNEPEGIISGWSLGNCDGFKCPPKYTLKEVQVFVNQFAGAIRSIDQDAFVTVGSGVAKSTSLGWYSDSALKAAGGHVNGTVTHCSLHYYPYGSSECPFDFPASYWGVDKPVIIGEFPGIGFNQNAATQKECSKTYKLKTSQYKSSKQCYEHAYNTGYAGLAGWQYKPTSGCNKKFIGDWEDMKLGVQALKGKQCISLTDPACKVGPGSPPPPATSCSVAAKTLTTNSASWLVRNGWNLNDGSTLSDLAQSVSLQPRKWGRDFYWLVYSADKVCVKKGEKYTIKLNFAESSSNKISNSAVQCSSSNGCLGKTVESLSVAFVKSFSATTNVAEGVDSNEFVKATNSASGAVTMFTNKASSPTQVPATLTVDMEIAEDATGVNFAIKIDLFGKPSLATNKYTVGAVSMTRK